MQLNEREYFYKKSLTFFGNKKDPALLTVAKLIAEPMDSQRGVFQSILASSICQLWFIVHRNHQTYLIFSPKYHILLNFIP